MDKMKFFSRVSFEVLTILILFSIVFTHMYTEKIFLFVTCTLICLPFVVLVLIIFDLI